MSGARVCMIAYTDYVFDARVRREAETLAASGFQVLFLKVRNGAKPLRYTMNGVDIRELDIPKYQGKSAFAYLRSYSRFLLAGSAVCLGLLARRRLDVVHVHNLPDFLVFAGLIPRLARCKVVLDVHDSVPETFATKFSNSPAVWRMLCLEEKLSALVADKVICVNHPQRDTLVARGIPSRKTFVSMNVPDPDIFTGTPNDCRLPSPDRNLNIVYHGTMAERLGVDLLIRAVAALRDRIPGVQLHLWGRGDDLPALYALVDNLGVRERVHFQPGGYPLDELPRHLRSMDLGAIGNRPSVAGQLMLPVKLVEYVSLGIPVVAPRLRTIAHYFSDDMVSFYEPDCVGSLADAIDRLWKNPEQRRAQAERGRAFIDQHGWDRQGPELVRFYQELVGGRST